MVIGILIALQINNWNEYQKNSAQEKRYLNDLVRDLTQDSINLTDIFQIFEEGVESKRKLEIFFNSPGSSIDSAAYHVTNQWDATHDFIPQSTTMEELKSSGKLDLISSIELRRKLVGLYNIYEELIRKLKLGDGKSQELIDIISKEAYNIAQLSEEEAYRLIRDPYFTNKVRLNYYYTQYSWCDRSLESCKNVLALLRNELSKK